MENAISCGCNVRYLQSSPISDWLVGYTANWYQYKKKLAAYVW